MQGNLCKKNRIMQIICNKLRDCLMPADKQNQTVSVTMVGYMLVCVYTKSSTIYMWCG